MRTGTVRLGTLVAALLLSGPIAAHAQNPVRDVDNPARQPFQVNLSDRIVSELSDAPLELAVVPQGKRLVIEHASVRGLFGAETAGGDIPSIIEIGVVTLQNGVPAEHQLVPTIVKSNAEQNRVDVFVASQPMRAYADPGTTVSLRVSVITEGDGSGNALLRNIALSGYFVDIQ
jgi:hypothetical protein